MNGSSEPDSSSPLPLSSIGHNCVLGESDFVPLDDSMLETAFRSTLWFRASRMDIGILAVGTL